MTREGGQGFFSFDMLKGDGRGRKFIYFFLDVITTIYLIGCEVLYI
jgi:hypothetical protein